MILRQRPDLGATPLSARNSKTFPGSLVRAPLLSAFLLASSPGLGTLLATFANQPTRSGDASFLITLSDHRASFDFSANVSRRMRANHGANPKGSKEGRRMNDTQTLILIHAVAWPIMIWALSKTWSSSRNAVRFSSARTMKRPLIRV